MINVLLILIYSDKAFIIASHASGTIRDIDSVEILN